VDARFDPKIETNARSRVSSVSRSPLLIIIARVSLQRFACRKFSQMEREMEHVTIKGIVELSFLRPSRKLRDRGEILTRQRRAAANSRKSRAGAVRLLARLIALRGFAFSRRRGRLLAFYPRNSQKECASFDPFTRGLINLTDCFSDARFLVSSPLLFLRWRFARVHVSPRYHISRHSRNVTCRILRVQIH